MDEDLNQNIFYKTIKSKFPKVFQLVESKLYTLCIPQYSSLYGMNISQKVVESHILVESKYYQSEYDALSNDESYIIENGILVLKRDATKRVKILFDEICYNKEFKSYRLLCIEAPLVGGTGIKPSMSTDNDLGEFQGISKPTRPTFEQAVFFLLGGSSQSPNSIVIRKAHEQINEFEDNNDLVKGSENVFFEKIKVIHERVLDDLICANAEYKQLQSNEKQIANLSIILESYIMGKLFNKVYEELKVLYKKENQQLYDIVVLLSKHSLEDLGIKSQFEPHLIEACTMMTVLYNQDVQTPFDKLLSAIQSSAQIEESIKATSLLEAVDSDQLQMTADDSLPILSYLLIQARPKYLETDLKYCTNFIFTEIHNSSYGYHLVNFTAAINYIKSLAKTLNLVNSNGVDEVAASTSPPSSLSSNSSLNNNDVNSPSTSSSSSSERKNSYPPMPTFSSSSSFYINDSYNSSSFTNSNRKSIQSPFTSTPNLNYTTPSKVNESYMSSPLPPQQTINNNTPREFSKPPNVIMLDDDEDDNHLGDFIGRLRDMKDDVVVSSQFK
ncbi:hypothetical protein DLAC_04215 [Tieghemostelium lacteum]|uniref:VPS9 domain-containing protein n=1 Tax=Tieghemostelium lacteum TaxID=361077 RepID=A0A151ZSI4_TIELA|nr:hypothetical protein DLAC_04215 [Tieghemostelium lacteum]|eukprot:KYQ96898.1 hypothetical protein DLAC_04215 [Tieghemostelium lacteum]